MLAVILEPVLRFSGISTSTIQGMLLASKSNCKTKFSFTAKQILLYRYLISAITL